MNHRKGKKRRENRMKRFGEDTIKIKGKRLWTRNRDDWLLPAGGRDCPQPRKLKFGIPERQISVAWLCESQKKKKLVRVNLMGIT